MELDPKKIESYLRTLNKGLKDKPWTPLPNNYAIVKIDIRADETSVFHPDTGLPLKAFVNVNTGEIRVVHTNALKYDDEKK